MFLDDRKLTPPYSLVFTGQNFRGHAYIFKKSHINEYF